MNNLPNGFLEREQLEAIVHNQQHEINLLRQNRNFDRNLDLFFYITNAILLSASGFLVLITKFKSDDFVTFSIFLSLGFFIGSIFRAYIRKKKYNEDYLTNDELVVFPESIKHISTDSLKLRITECVNIENYELAILLRNELKKRIK
jgi:hypothetical protein